MTAGYFDLAMAGRARRFLGLRWIFFVCVMVLHGVSWCAMVRHGASWCFMVLHGASWVSWRIMVLHGFSWGFMVLVVRHGASWCIMGFAGLGGLCVKPMKRVLVFHPLYI